MFQPPRGPEGERHSETHRPPALAVPFHLRHPRRRSRTPNVSGAMNHGVAVARWGRTSVSAFLKVIWKSSVEKIVLEPTAIHKTDDRGRCNVIKYQIQAYRSTLGAREGKKTVSFWGELSGCIFLSAILPAFLLGFLPRWRPGGTTREALRWPLGAWKGDDRGCPLGKGVLNGMLVSLPISCSRFAGCQFDFFLSDSEWVWHGVGGPLNLDCLRI